MVSTDDIKILKNFVYEEESYYVEIFQLSDKTYKAFAKKNTNLITGLFDTSAAPTGMGVDCDDSQKAANLAIKDLKAQGCI